MPRTKKQAASEAPPANQTAEALIAEHNKLEEWLKGENKRFGEHCKPYKDRLEVIGNQLLALSNQQKWDNIKTAEGTAYRSTLLNVSISPDGAPYTSSGPDGVLKGQVVGREALLDFCLDNWEDVGNDLLLISAQKDAVRRYMEQNAGKAPPGIVTSFFTRINIRRS